jgi:TolB protein
VEHMGPGESKGRAMARRRTLYLPLMIAAAVLAVACAVALLLAVSGEKAQAAFPGKNGRIAFSFLRREPGSAWQIVTIKPDGTGEKRLTHSSSVQNYSPSYSPDGAKITWQRNDNIWVMDADGTGQERLTSGLADDRTPAFSPDGREVAFSRSPPGEDDAGIWVKKLKGGEDAKRITAENGGYEEYGPVFGPDGGRIAFARAKSRPGCADCIVKSELATVRPDGTGLKVLTHTPSAEPDSPDWSPDGRKLVFALSAGLAGPVRIQTIKADGTNRRTVAATIKGGRFLLGPVFSPDGKKVAFERVPDKGDSDVWVMGADGTNPTDVTPIPKRSRGRFELEPDWGARLTTAK